MQRLGKTALIISGYRTPAHSVAVGGFANDPHTKGIAVDATVNGQPIGYVPGFVAAANSIGLISGNQPNFYKGHTDPGHVQLGGGSTVAAQKPVEPTIKPPPPSPHDPPGFAVALLNRLGITPTTSKVNFLNWWFDNEGNNGPPGQNGVNNPLNVSPGGSVANYATMQEGVNATASVLEQSNFSTILNVFKNPNATGAQLAAAVETSPWASSHYGGYNANGDYVGGDLIKPYLPAITSSGGLSGILGQIGHNIAHPGSGLQTTVGAAEGVVTGPIKSTGETIGMYLLYGVAFVAAVIVILTGIILIGADLGIGLLGRTRAAKAGNAVTRKIPVRRKPAQEDETVTAYRQGVRQGQISRARSEGRKVGAGQMEKQKVRVVPAGNSKDYQAQQRRERTNVKVTGPGELPKDF